ncbi:general secretion pathway protein G [Hydrogenophaga palleronii]|uniref:General secretion pathway protein G n=2 Tax=Hydrogenophaga palleronii TaxID=65655 RepID=A0ABU1WUR4_9BURK|nr:general secretion pathway protein G [Hydrogenophaga palleronii]
MLTLAIMAILVTVAVPLVQVSVQREKERELRTALTQIRDALDAYKRATEQGRIPANIGESGYPKTLEALVEGVEDQRSPTAAKLYFLRRLPSDPMSATQGLSAEQTWNLRSYQSPPDDPQEGDDVFDIYSKSDKVGLNGVPYRDW